MKKYFNSLIALMVLMFVSALVGMAQAVGVPVGEAVKENFLLDFFMENIETFSVLALWLVARLVPTRWKDPVLALITWLISIVPDKKAGGGKHLK